MTEVIAPTEFVFNHQQEAALRDMVFWRENLRASRSSLGDSGSLLPYILQGFAGTGKTTLVKELLDRLKIPLSRIALVAPTNRAAKVLANKTGMLTRTLFSLIYSSDREELDYERARLRIWDEASNFSQLADLLIVNMDQNLEEEFRDEWMENGGSVSDDDYAASLKSFVESRQVRVLKLEDIELPEDHAERLELFVDMKGERIKQHKTNIKDILDQDMRIRKRNATEISAKYDAILCDESSMVTYQQGVDLASYGVPVIMVGDPFQLPPVKAKAYWDGMKPDSQLTKIERQKGLGAGIPLAGELLRTGKPLKGNSSFVIHPRNSLSDEQWLEADQILVGTHKTRERMCNYIRKLRNFNTIQPVAGEKVVAVFNDKAAGIMNGELYQVLDSELIRGGSVTSMHIRDPYGKEITTKAWTQGFGGRSKTDYLDDEFGKFWFGYAITCHQSQGSEWKHVIVCDDWPRHDKDTYDRWLYTAITRASQHCDLIR